MPYSPTWNNPYIAPQQTFYPYPAMPQQQSNIIKVNGPSSALQYPVLANTQSPPLFDSAGGLFYIVTADGAGSKTIEAFDYSPHVEAPAPTAVAAVGRDEFDQLCKQVTSLKEEYDGILGSIQTANTTTYAATAVGEPAPNRDAGF